MSDGGEPHLNWCRVGHRGECDSLKVELIDIMGTDDPVFAQWFSRQLRASMGNMIESIHIGSGSRYEKHLLLDVDMGLVTRAATVSRRWRFWTRRAPS
jgi:hypothetical protein